MNSSKLSDLLEAPVFGVVDGEEVGDDFII